MENANSKQYLSIYDYYKIVLKYKKYIISIVLFFGILTAIIVFFIMDPIFISKATVKSTQKSSGLSGLLSGTTAGISELAELGGGSGSYRELALYENILTSRRCIDDVLIKFKLNDEWEFKYFQDAVKHFRENVLYLSKDKVAATMEIGIYDKYPERAKEIVAYIITLLNKINTEMNVLNAKNYREFIEGRYAEIQKNVKSAEDSLKRYQDIAGVAPDLQITAVTQSVYSLEAQIKSEEIKLELLYKVLNKDQPEILIQEDKIKELKKQLNIMQSTESNGPDDIFKLKGAPAKLLNFYRLKRDVEIQNKLLTYILPLYEQAKIEEKKETPTVILLDYPDLPEKKVRPKRLTITVFVMALAFIISSLFFAIFDKKELILSKIKK